MVILRSVRITGEDASCENHRILHLFPMELSLTHNVKRCPMLESPIKSQKINSQTSRRTKIKKKCSKDFVYKGYYSPGYKFKLQSLLAKLKAI